MAMDSGLRGGGIEPFGVLLETGISPAGFRSVAETATLLCEKVVEIVGCAMAALRIPDEDQRSLSVVSVAGAHHLSSEHAAAMRQERLDLAGLGSSVVRPGQRSPSVAAFHTGQPQILPRTAGSDTGFTMHSLAALPLVRNGRTIGVLSCYWSEPNGPSPATRRGLDDAVYATAFALDLAATAAAVERARAAEARRAETAEERAAASERAVAFRDSAARTLASGQPATDAVLEELAHATGLAFEVIDDDGALLSRCGEAATQSGATSAIPIERNHRRIAELRVWPAIPEKHASTIAFAASAIGIDLHRRVDAASTEARSAMLALLVRHNAPATAVQECSAALGVSRWREIEVVVALFESPEDAYACCRMLSMERPLIAGIIAATCDENRVTVLRDAATSERALFNRLAREPNHVGTGMSGRFAGTGDLPRYADRASSAARISRTRGAPVPYDSIGATLEMLSSVPGPVARQLVGEILGPLEDYDARRGTRLIDTLTTYLGCNGSPAATAARLHVHVNTVNQRISRVMRLLDLDIRDYASVSRLSLALEWRNLLDGES